jgi:hypothetical protein
MNIGPDRRPAAESAPPDTLYWTGNAAKARINSAKDSEFSWMTSWGHSIADYPRIRLGLAVALGLNNSRFAIGHPETVDVRHLAYRRRGRGCRVNCCMHLFNGGGSASSYPCYQKNNT